MRTATENAYDSILDAYTPLDVKDILTNGASRKAKHHKSKDDILTWYAEHNEGLHHTLLDSSPKCFTYYMTCSAKIKISVCLLVCLFVMLFAHASAASPGLKACSAGKLHGTRTWRGFWDF